MQSFRITPELNTELLNAAKSAGLTTSEFIRAALLVALELKKPNIIKC